MDQYLPQPVLKFLRAAQSRVEAHSLAPRARVEESLSQLLRPTLLLLLSLALAQATGSHLKRETLEDWKKNHPTPQSLWTQQGWIALSEDDADAATLFRSLPVGIDPTHSVYGVPASPGGWHYLAFFEREEAPVFFKSPDPALVAKPKIKMNWEPLGFSWDAYFIVESALLELKRISGKPVAQVAVRPRRKAVSRDPREITF